VTGAGWLVLRLAVGVGLCPLLPGLTQTIKARLQGRRGGSPLQPYRELRRLWGKSGVDPDGSGPVYRAAPAVTAAALVAALAVVPLAGNRDSGSLLGHDALVLVGLLALARFVVTLAAWDTGSGFALMGAGRDLTFAVFVEPLLLLVLILAALPSGSTDLSLLAARTAGSARWTTPVAWCAAAGFLLVVLAETGRQPIDNPDTHLELTMVHEGPLLEYAGRDLALLQWAAAARHWVVLVLAVTVFLPHGGPTWSRALSLVVGLPLLCAALALTETWQAKMRILRVPHLLLTGSLLALAGFASYFAIGAP